MMHRFLPIVLCLFSATVCAAQQTPADRPATREEIEKYLEVMHARDMTKQMIAVMTNQMRQVVHTQVSKNAANLPPDFEARMNRMLEDELKSFPIEEMFQAMIAVYQRHFTKGDVDALVAFYSSPTGQKILKDMPATVAEAMQAMQPIMQKRMETMMERVDQQIAQMVKDSKPKASKKPEATPN